MAPHDLQGSAQVQLHEHIRQEVEPAGVDEHGGEHPPPLVLVAHLRGVLRAPVVEDDKARARHFVLGQRDHAVLRGHIGHEEDLHGGEEERPREQLFRPALRDVPRRGLLLQRPTAATACHHDAREARKDQARPDAAPTPRPRLVLGIRSEPYLAPYGVVHRHGGVHLLPVDAPVHLGLHVRPLDLRHLHGQGELQVLVALAGCERADDRRRDARGDGGGGARRPEWSYLPGEITVAGWVVRKPSKLGRP
mmetsp:Transcript_1690/g.5012  ORF Transcript_1690/g.5012 Transcript_1690/m.5012 type:complete len:250 (-) Transcript_1690:309-1058(-)